MAKETVIRLHYRDGKGVVTDGQNDFDVSDFGGFLPSVGDLILDPGAPVGVDRRDPKSRRFWTVVQRVFNPRDLENYVALVVEERSGTSAEDVFVG